MAALAGWGRLYGGSLGRSRWRKEQSLLHGKGIARAKMTQGSVLVRRHRKIMFVALQHHAA
jgi:hypothetical protein